MSDDEMEIRPDASIEDITALLEYNKAKAAAIQEGLHKRVKEGKNIADTAAFHGDKQLEGVLDKK